MSKFASIAAALLCAVGFTTAQANIIHYSTLLSGANEFPANASTATGSALVDYDDLLRTLTVHVNFAGLTAPAAAGHIHCCTAPGSNVTVAIGFTGLSSATSGIYDHIFDLTDLTIYNVNFRNNFGGGTAAGAEAALAAGLANPAHFAYVNLHDSAFPGGEVRGNLALLAVPEPAGLALVAMSLAALGATSRRKSA